MQINDVEIWFQDEARFGQQGSLSRLWAIKGTRPRAVRQQQLKYTYLFGAVCPERGDAVGLLLPYANKDTMDMLEIVIWKTLSEMQGLLEKLPYRIGLKIEEEIAHILIENPKKKFSSLVHCTVRFFQRTMALLDAKTGDDVERKIHTWVVQGDMLYRFLPLDQDSPLAALICQEWCKRPAHLPHALFVAQVCQEYLKQHPELALYAGQLSKRVWILYKHAWYSLFGSNEESSYERFLKWHALSIQAACPGCSKEHCTEKLQEIVKKILPLVPFDAKHCLDNIY